VTASLIKLFIVGTLPAQAPGAGDEVLLRELRARGLSELTEAYSRKRLSDSGLDPAAREAAAFELAAGISRRASTETNAAPRRHGWAESDAILEPWLRAATGTEPEAYDLRRRYGLLLRDRAETCVELLKAVPNDADLADDARTQARLATEHLEKLAVEVRKRMNEAAGSKKFDQLANLDIRVDFDAGVAYAIAAAATPPGAARNASVEHAENRLRNYTRTFSILSINLEAILALSKLFKDVERYDEATQIISVFELHPETPPTYAQRAELLAAQILLAQNKPSAALAKLSIPENKRLPNSGEWDVTLFEAMLRASRSDVAPPKGRRDEAIDLLSSLEKKYGGYWKARGEHVLAKYGDPDVVGDNPRLLARVAALRRERKELDAAVSMYDRAAQLDRAAGAAESAARLALAAAATTLEKGDARGAAQRYVKIAEELGPSPLSADALLGGARALYSAAHSGDVKAKSSYRTALDQLLALPKADPTIRNEANWLRGRLAEEEKDYPAAAARFREIPPDHPRGAAALGALANVHFQTLLSGTERFGRERTVAAAVEDLEGRLKAVTGNEQGASGNRAVAAWVLARLIADYQPERLAEAIRLVETHVVVEPSFPQAQNRVWHLLLAWHLRLGDPKGAAAVMDRGFANDPKGLARELLQRLSPLAEGLSETEAAARTAAAQHAAEFWLGKSDQLPDAVRLSFKLVSGEALAAKKEYADAARVLRQLREEAPRDRGAAKALARVLSLAGEYRESLEEWKLLVRGLRPGEEDWLNAVAEVARCHLELGDRISAERLVKNIEANHQGKGSPEVRKKFAELQKRISR